MSLCEITPVGEDPYYCELNTRTYFETDSALCALSKKHKKGFKVVSLDEVFQPSYLMPDEKGVWWVVLFVGGYLEQYPLTEDSKDGVNWREFYASFTELFGIELKDDESENIISGKKGVCVKPLPLENIRIA